MHELARETAHVVQLNLAAGGEAGRFHAVFCRPGGEVSQGAQGPEFPLMAAGLKPLVAYASDPRRGFHLRRFTSDLRQYLQTKLPEYMIPAAFVTLQSLPLTSSGKLDRRALPPLEASASAIRSAYTVPRTPTEEALAGIWAQFLGIEMIGTQDNFFEMGGHSLLATRVLSRMREAFNVDLPLRAFFETPTIARIAELLEEARERDPEPLAPTIVRVSREAHLATLLPGGQLDPADLVKGRRKETRMTTAGNGSPVGALRERNGYAQE